MTSFFAALGSNLGDREGLISAALRALAVAPGVEIDRISSIYETEPVGPADQPDYLNAVVGGRSPLAPAELLSLFERTEIALGRRRRPRWREREIDIDLLLLEDRVVRTPILRVPHPRMCGRRFVLVPLAEVAPEARHPLNGLTAAELLSRCPETHALRRIGSLEPSGALVPC